MDCSTPAGQRAPLDVEAAAELLKTHSKCPGCAGMLFGLQELLRARGTPLRNYLTEGDDAQHRAREYAETLFVVAGGAPKLPALHVTCLGDLIVAGLPRAAVAPLHDVKKLKAVSAVLETLEKKVEEIHVVESCAGVLRVLADDRECLTFACDGGVFQTLLRVSQTLGHERSVQLVVCEAMARICADRNAGQQGIRLNALEIVTTCSMKAHRSDSRVVEAALNAITWLIRAEVLDIPARATNLDLHTVVFEATSPKFLAEPTISAATADFYSCLLAAADAYPEAAAKARAAAAGSAARARVATVEGSDRLAGHLPRLIEQLMVKPPSGLNKLMAAAAAHRKNLRLTQSVCRLISGLFQDRQEPSMLASASLASGAVKFLVDVVIALAGAKAEEYAADDALVDAGRQAPAVAEDAAAPAAAAVQGARALYASLCEEESVGALDRAASYSASSPAVRLALEQGVTAGLVEALLVIAFHDTAVWSVKEAALSVIHTLIVTVGSVDAQIRAKNAANTRRLIVEVAERNRPALPPVADLDPITPRARTAAQGRRGGPDPWAAVSSGAAPAAASRGGAGAGGHRGSDRMSDAAVEGGYATLAQAEASRKCEQLSRVLFHVASPSAMQGSLAGGASETGAASAAAAFAASSAAAAAAAATAAAASAAASASAAGTGPKQVKAKVSFFGGKNGTGPLARVRSAAAAVMAANFFKRPGSKEQRAPPAAASQPPVPSPPSTQPAQAPFLRTTDTGTSVFGHLTSSPPQHPQHVTIADSFREQGEVSRTGSREPIGVPETGPSPNRPPVPRAASRGNETKVSLSQRLGSDTGSGLPVKVSSAESLLGGGGSGRAKESGGALGGGGSGGSGKVRVSALAGGGSGGSGKLRVSALASGGSSKAQGSSTGNPGATSGKSFSSLSAGPAGTGLYIPSGRGHGALAGGGSSRVLPTALSIGAGSRSGRGAQQLISSAALSRQSVDGSLAVRTGGTRDRVSNTGEADQPASPPVDWRRRASLDNAGRPTAPAPPAAAPPAGHRTFNSRGGGVPASNSSTALLPPITAADRDHAEFTEWVQMRADMLPPPKK